MIKLLADGNIFACAVQAIVNPVNCVGVMGAGLALQFKNNYPENFLAYKSACNSNLVKLGSMFIHHTGNAAYPGYIINFPTKQHWGDKSHLWAIRVGLIDMVDQVRQLEIESIAVPPIGCGLGGLSWGVVKPKIFQALECLPDVEVVLFEPKNYT